MPNNSQNQVTWENVNSIFTNSFNDHRQDIQEHYDIAENNIKAGIKPSPLPGEPTIYEILKKT